MKLSGKCKSLTFAGLTVLLLAGCGGEPDGNSNNTSMNATSDTAGDSSQDSLPDVQSLIESSTAVVETRIAEAEDIEVGDVIPPEYLESGAAAADVTGMALATLEPVEGFDVAGVVVFIQESAPEEDTEAFAGSLLETGSDDSDGEPAAAPVRVVAKFNGLAPGPHGFHILETGDCSALDTAQARAHFNPGDAEHGGPGYSERHVGDLGNISADAFGVSTQDTSDSLLTLSGSSSVIGRAVVVHAGIDDFSTQPDGDAGDIVSCGVIDSYP